MSTMQTATPPPQNIATAPPGAGASDAQLLKRFIERQDEAAFEALVQVHAPMVLGVCRRVLGNHHDAEDAFQATFLVLARKAASIVPRELVGNWIYGVAYRTALKARGAAFQRRTREKQVTEMPEPKPLQRDSRPDLQPVLDQELSRLPDKYRVPIVLCDLEGRTHADAARQLGCPEGTVSVRLMRARRMLATRLLRHGVVISTGSLAVVLTQSVAEAAPSSALMLSTVKAATLFAAQKSVPATLAGGNVVSLSEGVLRSMLFTKLEFGLGILVVVAALGLRVSGMIYEMQTPPTIASHGIDATPPAQFVLPEIAIRHELDKLQGTWNAVQVELKGRKVPEEELKAGKLRLVIAGDNLLVTAAGYEQGSKTATLLIDPTQHPKVMDWSTAATHSAGATPAAPGDLNVKGVYELDGDTLKFRYGKERPSELASASHPDQRMYVFQREKN